MENSASSIERYHESTCTDHRPGSPAKSNAIWPMVSRYLAEKLVKCFKLLVRLGTWPLRGQVRAGFNLEIQGGVLGWVWGGIRDNQNEPDWASLCQIT